MPDRDVKKLFVEMPKTPFVAFQTAYRLPFDVEIEVVGTIAAVGDSTLGSIVPAIGAGGFVAATTATGFVAGSVAVAASFGSAGVGLTRCRMATRIGSLEEFELKEVGDIHYGRLDWLTSKIMVELMKQGVMIKHTHRSISMDVDIICESVGGDMLRLCFNALAVHRRLIVIGMIYQYQGEKGWTPSNYPRLCEKILAKSQTVVGFFLVQFSHLLFLLFSFVEFSLRFQVGIG
ncbi:hypothetical protein SESBI_21431 [Sesbania bispinosa]|nr:hypothetical protein SESBI_21431 [Sesbania bispinosa]